MPTLQRAALASFLLALGLLVTGCASPAPRPGQEQDERLRIVTTTNIVGDLAAEIAGDSATVESLMGPGVDPHLYRASAGDVRRLAEADLVLYNGLDLEGKMTDVFAQMRERGIPTHAIAEEALPDSALLESPEYAGNYDPHVWFDVSLWKEVARHVGDLLADRDPARGSYYRERAARYASELDSLHAYTARQAARIPEWQRVLITSHDAFSYFGRAYEIEVRGLQGISTAAEAGAGDVARLAQLVADRRISALFVESSVSPRGIEAVREAVREAGFDVRLGGTLYGDALGDAGTPTGSYVGALRHNIDTVVSGLIQQPS